MKQIELFNEKNHSIRLNEVCQILAISTATARNWIRSGKLKPIRSQGREMFFHANDVDQLLKDIKAGTEGRLKSRRNKQHIKGALIPKTYIQSKVGIETVEEIISQTNSIELPRDYERIILAEYALRLLVSRQMIEHPGSDSHSDILSYFVKDKAWAGVYAPLIDDILGDITAIDSSIEKLKPTLSHTIDFIEDQDFLGLLFMSLQCLSERKSKGVYYTPLAVVQEAVDNLFHKKILNPGTKLIDPCCGTGNFLMYAYKNVQSIENLYGYDISSLSVGLTRLNMALVSQSKDIQVLYRNYQCKDSLRDKELTGYDIVIGNPPWGFSYNDEQETFLRSHYVSARVKTVESFCVFTEYALEIAAVNGVVCLILPQSLLNVKLHQPVRDYLMRHCTIKRIRYWENIFDGVLCPAMTLTFEKKGQVFTTKGMEVVTNAREFVIQEERILDRTNWHLDITDEERLVIKKIESSVAVRFLKDNADFALGIVTGDNSTHILNDQIEGSEIILKGGDVFKYRYISSNNFISFEPEKFQQIAPAVLYRAEEKLIYRFICDSLVFAYDNKQTLTLNSANVIIPRFSDLDIKYILAVLNSRVIQYYFKHQFKSVKILRTHLENLPIPVLSPFLQNEIIINVDSLLRASNPTEAIELYNLIDIQIKNIFNLTGSEYNRIKAEASKYNLFLLGK